LSPTRATPHHWGEPRAIFFSLGVHSTVVSALPWPGHHGLSPRHVCLILCSLYHPDTHRPSTFLSEVLDAMEHVLTTESTVEAAISDDHYSAPPFRVNPRMFPSLGELLSVIALLILHLPCPIGQNILTMSCSV
jgi:hypothetical protein